VDIDVLANDSDVDGDALGVTGIANVTPAGATAVANPDNTITYTPSVGFGGTDSFDYTATNGQSSDTGTVTVRIPKANYDEYSVNKPESASLGASAITIASESGLLANDFCSAATCTVTGTTWVPIPGTVQVGNTAYRGTLTMSANGGFSYTPPAKNDMLGAPNNFVEFAYVLTDASSNTATGTMRIYFRNIAPDTAVTNYVSAVDIDLANGDTCYDTSGRNVATCTGYSVSGSQTQPDIDGTVSITPAGGSTARYTPRTGFWGLDVFYYTVQSTSLLTDNPVTVLVAPPAATVNTGFGTTVREFFTTTDYIVDHGSVAADTIENVDCTGCTYAVAEAPAKGSVELVSSLVSGTTHWEWVYTPDDTSTGQDFFSISVTSPGGLSVTTRVTVNIGPLAVDDSYSVLAKSTLSFDVLTNDICPATCTVTWTAPARGTLTAGATPGSFTYVNNTDVGTFTFDYSIQTSEAVGIDTGRVSILVEGAENDDVIMLSGETARTINVRANDPCLDCTIGNLSQPAIGTATLNSNGTITYVPPSTFAGSVSFRYGLSKGGSTTYATVTVTVPPKALNDVVYTTAGSTLTIDPLLNDICADCRITSTAEGTLSDDGFTISLVASSTRSFTYVITDSTSLTATATITVYVTSPPTAADDAATTPAETAVIIDVLGGAGADTVTMVTGFMGIGLPEKEALCKKMRTACGCGGTVKDGDIEIQGDQRDKIATILTTAGFRPVFAGG
jgi:translation initiation factor 1 (eIF-1/SUI1)